MGYGSDDRYGNRGQGREPGRWDQRGDGGGWDEGRRDRMGWGPGGRDRDRDEGRAGGGEDRGFFERAGEQVRSWLGSDDDDERRYRGQDEGRNRGYEPGRERGEGGSYGWMSGGWGNQAGESWNRDRPGVREEREGGLGGSQGGQRGEPWGGGDTGGSARYGVSPRHRGGQEPHHRQGGQPSQPGGHHDPHYSEWRRRQIEDLDRDYDEYRREHQSKFEQEFGSWRTRRQGQRQMLGKVGEQMEVVGSDGSAVGTVDAVRGDRIILTKSHENAGGMHHSIPCSWVEAVEERRVTLNRTAEQAISEWRDEERNRALFERQDQGSEGPHMLNRSFSGTYSDRDEDR